MPTLRAELIYTVQKEREMRIHLMGVTVWYLDVVTSSAENFDNEISDVIIR